MKPSIFKDNDIAYLLWIDKNPNGLVINSYRNLNLAYLVLHKAKCKKINSYNKMAQPGGFTERDFIKICANSSADLLNWVKEQGANDFSKCCALCNAG